MHKYKNRQRAQFYIKIKPIPDYDRNQIRQLEQWVVGDSKDQGFFVAHTSYRDYEV